MLEYEEVSKGVPYSLNICEKYSTRFWINLSFLKSWKIVTDSPPGSRQTSIFLTNWAARYIFLKLISKSGRVMSLTDCLNKRSRIFVGFGTSPVAKTSN